MNELLQLRNPVTCPCESTNWDYWDGVLLGSLTSQYLSEGQKECLWITSILTPFRRAPPDLCYPITHGMTRLRSTNGLITQERKQIK